MSKNKNTRKGNFLQRQELRTLDKKCSRGEIPSVVDYYAERRKILIQCAPTYRLRRGKWVTIPEEWRGNTVWPGSIRRRRTDREAKRRKPLSHWGIGHKGGKDKIPPRRVYLRYQVERFAIDEGE